jgi:hypothetical protein
MDGYRSDQTRVDVSFGQSQVTCTATTMCSLVRYCQLFFALAPGQVMVMDSIAVRTGKPCSTGHVPGRHAEPAACMRASAGQAWLSRLRRGASALVRIHFEAGARTQPYRTVPPTRLVGRERRVAEAATARHGGDKLVFLLETIRSQNTKLLLFRPCSSARPWAGRQRAAEPAHGTRYFRVENGSIWGWILSWRERVPSAVARKGFSTKWYLVSIFC